MASDATLLAEKTASNIPGSGDTVKLILEYLFSLPSQVLLGDYFAIMVSSILGYLILIVLHQISGLFLIVIKKTIAFVVTGLALLMIYHKFIETLTTEGFSVKTFIIGVMGLVIAFLGTFISFYALFKQTKKAISDMGQEEEDSESVIEEIPIDIEELKSLKEKPHTDINQMKELKTFFSLDSLKNDKSLLSVLTFLIVAEFGVFSSNTISAPNPKIGIIMFVIFMISTFIFIKQSYRSYTRGLSHIVFTFCLGGTLALVLGYFWTNIPIAVLFSLEVFQTDVLVALISGMALSLFAGSRK